MKVCIYSTEGTFQGLHDICDYIVTEVDSIKGAIDIGLEMARELIDCYDCWEDEIEDYEDIDEFYDNHEFNAEVWAIKDNISLTTEELNTILCKEGIEIFTKEYCGEALN